MASQSEDAPRLKFRSIGVIIRASGLVPWTVVFLVLCLLCAVLISAFEPSIDGFGNSLWLVFQVVTTIGLGDYTATSAIGRIAAVLLSIYSVFYIALITGAVVSYCTERMRARRNESIAHFIDQLEHLPELDKDELAALSDKVKRLKRNL